MKKIISFAISLIIGLGLFILVLERVGIQNIFESIKELNPLIAGLAVAVFLVAFLVSTFRWGLILKTKGYRLPFIQLLIAKLSDFAVSYVTPVIYVGGEWVRSYIIKKEANVPMVKGLASVIVDKIMDIIMGALMLLLGAFVLLVKIDSAQSLYLALAMIILSLGCLLFLYSRISKNEKIFVGFIRFFGLNKIKYVDHNTEKIHQMEDEIYGFFRNQPRAFLWTLLLGIAETILSLIVFKIILIALSFNIPFVLIILIRAIAMLISLIPIPAALGVYEGSIAFAFGLLSLEVHMGVVFSLIIRCLYLILVALGLVSLSHFGIKLTRAMAFKEFNGNSS